MNLSKKLVFTAKCGLPNSMLTYSDWPETKDYFGLKSSRPKNMPDLFHLYENAIINNLIAGEMVPKNSMLPENIMMVEISNNMIKQRILRYFKYAKEHNGMYIEGNPNIPPKSLKDKGVRVGYMPRVALNKMINYCDEFVAVIEKKLEEYTK